MSITVKNITKTYGTQKALDSVSLEIKPGEVVGLLGPNGAGKSTLMKILTCFIPPTTGDASVCGFDVIEQSIEVRKKVGYLPENNPLYLDMYVKEFLSFIEKVHQPFAVRSSQFENRSERQTRNGEQKIAEIIELTGLGSEQHKKIGALSRGYRQRVGIAHALLHEPEVLILDEPTSGLDPNQILEIRSMIKNIGREKTVMLSTHIMQEAEAICNRAIIIHKGKIVADDQTKNIRNVTSSKNLILVEFGSAVEPGQLLKIPGVRKVDMLSEFSFQLSTVGRDDIRAGVFKFAVDNHLTVLSLVKEEQKLEEVFQELTREK